MKCTVAETFLGIGLVCLSAFRAAGETTTSPAAPGSATDRLTQIELRLDQLEAKAATPQERVKEDLSVAQMLLRNGNWTNLNAEQTKSLEQASSVLLRAKEALSHTDNKSWSIPDIPNATGGWVAVFLFIWAVKSFLDAKRHTDLRKYEMDVKAKSDVTLAVIRGRKRDASHTETEIKRRLVGEGAADKLLAALGEKPRELKKQVNHIFDTDDRRLNKARYALRLREENHQASLTAKGPAQNLFSSTTVKEEVECAVDQCMAHKLLQAQSDPLEVMMNQISDPECHVLLAKLKATIAGCRLGIVGKFENERRTVDIVPLSNVPLKLELDRTTFPDGSVDEEIEIELPRKELAAPIECWLDNLTRGAGIKTANTTPKIARFFASLH